MWKTWTWDINNQCEICGVCVFDYMTLPVLLGGGCVLISVYCHIINNNNNAITNKYIFCPSNRVTTSATRLRLIFKHHRRLPNTIIHLVSRLQYLLPGPTALPRVYQLFLEHLSPKHDSSDKIQALTDKYCFWLHIINMLAQSSPTWPYTVGN